jgi:DDE family transposase
MNTGKLYHWLEAITKKWEGLTRHQRENIQLFSRGVVCAESCHERKIAGSVGGNPNSQRRKLQRFLGGGLVMKPIFQQWTGAVVDSLGLTRLTLAVDETQLDDRIGVMVVGLVYEGRCIPLAWRSYALYEAGTYPAEGQSRLIIRLLNHVRLGLPQGCAVRVLADRGIGTSPLLMRGIAAMGWTFLFRVTKQSKIVLADGREYTFYDQTQQPGDTWAASGIVFKQRGHIPAHVRVVWGEDAQEPWALVTNDPTLTGWEYAQRMWIELAFRDLKSHGWQWGRSGLTCPKRVDRLLILLVMAYTWMLIWGLAVAHAHLACPTKRCADGTRVRRLSLFREGLLAFKAALAPPALL